MSRIGSCTAGEGRRVEGGGFLPYTSRASAISQYPPDSEHRAPNTAQYPPRTEQRAPDTAIVSLQTIGDLIRGISMLLARANVPNSPREATDLIAAVLDVPRLWPALHHDQHTNPELVSRVLSSAERRASGAPFAYAVGRAAFRHLTLEIDDRVLIPRQETEILVEAVLTRGVLNGGLAIDIGTGSGAIALALASEGRLDRVIGTDISAGALAVARTNASRLASVLNAPIEFRHGAFFAPVADLRARLIVSNPPYISSSEAGALPAGVRDWEPPVALFSGLDGMTATAEVIRGAARVLEPFGLLALEVDSRRAGLAAQIATDTESYNDIAILPDLSGRDRILLATRTDR